MLSLTRKIGQTVVMFVDGKRIEVERTKKGFHVVAPKDVRVIRGELERKVA